MADDQFHFWQEALSARKPLNTERGKPRSGYYRFRNEAIAFWRDDGDALFCWRSGQWRAPTRPDEIDDLFGFCAPHPVSYEDFQFFRENERWPEQVEPVAAPDAGLPAHESADAELAALREQAKTWIAEIGSVKTQADADKSGNYADAFAKIEKRATEQHRAEKEPHLKAGRAVDAAWKPIIDRAAECKTWAKKAAESFLVAERKRIADEERKRTEEAARIAREAERARVEAEKAGAPPPVIETPVFASPPQKAKAGTAGSTISLRTRTVHEITDRSAFLVYLAAQNDLPEDFLDALRRLANKLAKAGLKTPGVETKTLEEVA